MPYYRDMSEVEIGNFTDKDEYIWYVLSLENETPYSLLNKDFNMPTAKYMPDGIYKVREANDRRLNANIEGFDIKFWQFHRDNGLSKLGFFDPLKNITDYTVQ